ncbi:MAG: hypothetical protein EU531_03430 [Promethearchaeota archaeon]|nr:MAG: hypothetical protein EU531_03430 [Candidatus Lokiarchaeota archaeon]
MDKRKYYKIVFLSGSLWNIAIAVIFTLLTLFALPLAATLFELATPPSLVFIYAFLALVFAIGIGLYTVSVDIDKNHGVVQMCAVEKYLVFIVFLIFFIMGDYNVGLFLPVVVDLIYGVLFTEFLLNYKKL